jgi:hypothetical protein
MEDYIIRGQTDFLSLKSIVNKIEDFVPASFKTIYLTLFFLDEKLMYELYWYVNEFDFGDDYKAGIEKWVNQLKSDTDLIKYLKDFDSSYTIDNMYFEVIIV